MNKQKPISPARVFSSRFTATLSISLVLFMVSIMLALGFIANHLSDYVRENVCLSAIVVDDLALPDAHMLQKKLEAMPWAKSVTFIDKEQALRELVDELGENPADLVGYNPALASYEIYLKADYAREDSIEAISSQLKQYKHVQDVVYRTALVHLVNENIRRIGFILLFLAVLLTLVSYSLIRNTVRLMMYSQRCLIRPMQLGGAGNGFILQPFIVENIISAIIASLLAMGYLYGILWLMNDKISGLFQILDFTQLGLIFCIVLLFGILIMSTATWLAVRRYIRMDTNELYYI
jgi:cell division transport system permease protein